MLLRCAVRVPDVERDVGACLPANFDAAEPVVQGLGNIFLEGLDICMLIQHESRALLIPCLLYLGHIFHLCPCLLCWVEGFFLEALVLILLFVNNLGDFLNIFRLGIAVPSSREFPVGKFNRIKRAKIANLLASPMLGQGSNVRATIGRNLAKDDSRNNALVVVDLTISSSSEDEPDEPSVTVDLQLYNPVKPRGHGQKRQRQGEWENEPDEPNVTVDMQLYNPVKPRGHGQKRQQQGEWHHFQDSHCTGSLPSKLRRKKTRHEQEDRAGMQKSQRVLHNHNVTLDSTLKCRQAADVVDIDDISPASAPLMTSALGLINDIGNRQDRLTSDRGRRGKLFHKNTPAPG